MANSFKDIIITPNRSSSIADPTIQFRGGNATANTTITLQTYPTSNGTLSFEGSAGQLFSITNDLSGTIFSVNDVSGIPSIEVNANGQINLAEFGGNVIIGNTTSNNSSLSIGGTFSVTGNANAGNIGATSGVFTAVSGNGSALTALNGSNITTGTVAQARLANSNVILGSTTLALGTTTTTIAGLSSVTSTTFVGALTGAATTAGSVTTNSQGNITSVGTLTGLTVSGVSNLGSNANVIITGGSSGQLLSTNGSGNLTWVSAAAGGGYYLHTQAVASTSWTVVHNLNRRYVTVEAIDATGNSYTGRYDYPTINYTNANAFTMTFVSAVTGYAAVTGGGTSTSVEVSSVANGNSSVGIPAANGNINLVSVGNATMIVTGTGVNVFGTLNTGSGVITGNGSGLSAIAGANVTGTVASATNSTTVGGLTPSATSGTASRVVVADASGYIYNNYFNSTDNSTASGVTAVMVKAGDNFFRSGTAAAVATFISGQTMNISGSATTAGTVTTAAQPNITSVGTQLAIGTTASIQTLTIGSGSSTSSGINQRTTTTDFSIVPSNSAAGGVTIATGWVSGGQGPLIFTTATGEILRFNNGSIVSPNLADAVGYKGLPQNAQGSGYTLALSDMGKHISISTGNITIPANGTVAFPIGATIVIYNDAATTKSILITTDTLRLGGSTSTGTRTLASYGIATLIKVTSTVWVVTGNAT